MKKKRAVVVGFDYYAKFLADLMNEQSAAWSFAAYSNSRFATVRALVSMRKADALICFGGPAPNVALIEAARKRNVPIVVIWAGSDVIKAQNDPFELEVIKQERFHNIADGPWLVAELGLLGIEADYEPLTAVDSGGAVEPFPREFRVLTYLPEPRREFYGKAILYDVAAAMPDVPFDVVGDGAPDPAAPPNVHFHGRVRDMPRRIDRCVVLLRQPAHDGKSMLVLEALARARHVVWNYEFPYVAKAQGTEEVLRLLRDLHDRHGRGELPLNHDGRTYVLNNFGRADVARRFERRLDALQRRRTSFVSRKRRVAISGLGLFCAQVAQLASSIAPEWESRLLRTNSRLEVVTAIATLLKCDVWYSIGSPMTDRWVHLAAKLLHKPRVIHWVGSDIRLVAEQRPVRSVLSAPQTIHLAEATWTAAQLEELGCTPRIAPLPPRHRRGHCMALPPTFTIMLYVPRFRSDFYGRPAFERLMIRLRDKPVRYVIVGGGDLQVPPGVDAANLGWRDDLYDVYENITALIRYTPHDGLSLMVLEALSFGRYVLWTQPFSHTDRIGSYGEMERRVRELFDLHERGELQPLQEAADMVQARYSPDVCVREIVHAWEGATA